MDIDESFQLNSIPLNLDSQASSAANDYSDNEEEEEDTGKNA